MFFDRSALIAFNPPHRGYGMAVTDIDHDGHFELIVTGFGHPNRVLKWDGHHLIDAAPPTLVDPLRHAIGLAAADIDADGREELYILNSDTFSGQKRLADRLFVESYTGWIDLFELPDNRRAINLTAGRSVAAIDRYGNGRYSFFVANYGGPMALYELDDDGHLHDVAPAAHLNLITGGRGVLAAPFFGPQIDLFTVNELGPNFFFRNRGDGAFDEMGRPAGLADSNENGRGLALVDSAGDGRLGLVYGNWEGPHRLFHQVATGVFRNIAPDALAAPSRVRTVIAADFDNDGYEEIFFNNIGQPNRLFAFRDGQWQPTDIGAALEPTGFGTGAAVADLDNDGRLELYIAHGESGEQPLSVYHPELNNHHWLRVQPLTREGSV